MRAQGYPGLATDGTQTSWLQDALDQFAGTRGQDHGNDFGAIAGVLEQGRYAIGLVGSDHLGHPVPNRIAVTGHWVAVFGWDGSNYHIANSGSGELEFYAGDYFASAYRGITLDTGVHPKGDEDMNPAKEESLDQAFAWEAFQGVLGRIADGQSFAWALGEARKSHSQLLWEIIQGTEFADPTNGGGLLGRLARLEATMGSLLSRLSAVEQQEAAEAAEKAQQDHLAAIAKAAQAIQTDLTSPLPPPATA